MYSGQQLATTTFNSIPKEVQDIIFSFLRNHDPDRAIQDIFKLVKLREVSKEWNQIVMSYLAWLWEQKALKGWVADFLKRENNPMFKQTLLTYYDTCQKVSFKALVAERNKTKSDLSQTGAFAEAALTHLVIRKKIEILAKLMKDSGLEVPETLQNFPPLTGIKKNKSPSCTIS